MISSRKNRSISISTQTYGALELIKNGILSNFSALMNAKQIDEVEASGYFNGEPMPYSFGFTPFGEENQQIAKELKKGERVSLVLDEREVGHIDVSGVFTRADQSNEKNIFLASLAPNEQAKLEKYYISGEFEIYDETMKDAKTKLLKATKEANARRVTAVFLTADPFNRAHERLVRMTIDKTDLVIIFLVGTTTQRQLDYDLRRRVLDYFNQNYLPKGRIAIFELRNTMLFSSHANPILECIAAHRFGADKLVIGQNHSGIGMFFDQNKAHTILDGYTNELKMQIIILPELVYCNECRTLVSTKTCPHGQHHHIKYHPGTIKALLFRGIMPPAILVRPDISALVLSELFPSRFNDIQKLCDDLFPNSGLLEKRSDKDFYVELMKLYQTSSMT